MVQPSDLELLLLLRDADQKLADTRESHYQAMRQTDQRALDLERRYTQAHFDRLDTDALTAKDYMSATVGASQGTDRTVAWVIAGISLIVAVVSVVYAIAG